MREEWTLALKKRLVECLQAKFSFWHEIPWKLIGVWHCMQGGDLGKSKEILAQCVQEYDSIVQAGKGRDLHRVAHRLLDPSMLCGSELRKFMHDGTLDQYSNAFCGLMEYALVSLVERGVEALHAKMKRTPPPLFSVPFWSKSFPSKSRSR